MECNFSCENLFAPSTTSRFIAPVQTGETTILKFPVRRSLYETLVCTSPGWELRDCGYRDMKLIPLKNSDKSAMVSDEDCDRVSAYEWRLDSNGYPTRCTMIQEGEPEYSPFGTMSLHHFIAGRVPGKLPDHKDRNPLNAQRDNIRHVSHRANLANSDVRNQFGYRGIYNMDRDGKRKLSKPWQSSFYVGRKRISLGTFKTAQEAAAAYDAECFARTGETFNGFIPDRSTS